MKSDRAIECLPFGRGTDTTRATAACESAAVYVQRKQWGARLLGRPDGVGECTIVACVSAGYSEHVAAFHSSYDK